jgi:DNA-binding protein H-NS|tara:strand:+ start:989 stop:1294 length:306 start_codon:yes stop_codon:yes gene_type:complete
MNILEKANQIINERSEEKERQYGPMSETNRRASVIASVMSNKDISVLDLYNMQIALKLARESWSHKEDNLLDVVAYVGGLNNYREGIRNEQDDIIESDEQK